jgi:hypothetical protein
MSISFLSFISVLILFWAIIFTASKFAKFLLILVYTLLIFLVLDDQQFLNLDESGKLVRCPELHLSKAFQRDLDK